MQTRRALVKQLFGKMSLRQKCEALAVNRSSLYYQATERPDDAVDIMNMIREIYTQRPFLGYRRITVLLKRDYGIEINRKRVYRLMQLMGLQAIYPEVNLSKRRQEDAVYPYLLKQQVPQKPNDAWGIDITYIRMRTGFVYLVALIDIVSRRIMGWDLSPFLETYSALKALKMALASGYVPRLINSDQGCQFTSQAWVKSLQEHNIQISMDGKGRCLDNIYIERFWRTIKYEEVYLKSYDTVQIAHQEIGNYIEWYNHERPHQNLRNQTPSATFKALVSPVESRDNALHYPPLPTGTTTSMQNVCVRV